jgi:predicted ester cyclase
MLKHSPLVLLVCLAACGSAEVEQPGPAPIDPRVYQPTVARDAGPQKSPIDRDRDSAEAFGRALAGNDVKALSDLLDPDVDFSFPGMPSATDRPGTLQAMNDLFGAFGTRKLTPSRVWQIGEAAVIEWSLTGAQSGPFMGVSPAQKPVSFRGVTLLWFNLNGLINEVHIYFDCGAVLAQLGAAPNPTIQAGPASAPDASPGIVRAGGTPEEKANVAVVNASWDALEAKNEGGYLAPIADDIEVTRLDRAAPERGKEERKKYFRWVVSGVSSLSQTPLNAWGAGNYVIEEYTITGVHSGKLIPSPPSGHALRLHYVDIDEMQNGKIVRTWVYGNSLELYAEAGAVPSGSPAAGGVSSAQPPAAATPAPPAKPAAAKPAGKL